VGLGRFKTAWAGLGYSVVRVGEGRARARVGEGKGRSRWWGLRRRARGSTGSMAQAGLGCGGVRVGEDEGG